MGQDSSTRASAVRNGFDRLPKWAKVAAIAAVAVIVLSAVTIPAAATAVDQHNRQLAHEVAEKKAAAAKKAAAEAAEVLADAKDAAAEFNAGFDGFSISLATAVSPDAAAAFEDARVKLADAMTNGEVDEVSAAMAAVADALDKLVASAQGQADALIDASPIADRASKDALIKAVTNLKGADDVKAALTQVKAASDAVVASQAAGKAAAAAAAAAKAAADAAAKQKASGSTGGDDSPNGDSSSAGPSNGGPSGGYDPGFTGMWPGEPAEICGSSTVPVMLDFRWEAREGNSVDIYYALTTIDAQATGGFTKILSRQGATGSVRIPRPCVPGSHRYITVKAVASNQNGSSTAYYWGI